MHVAIARSTGFCSGVMRAVAGAKDALDAPDDARETTASGERNRAASGGRIYCLGEIIHNPGVVRSLESQGLVVVDDIEAVPDGSRLVIRSHGLPRRIVERAAEKGLAILDFTCPKVKKIHGLVTELSHDGYFIIIAGNPKHPEVKAILSLAEAGHDGRSSAPDPRSARQSGGGALVVQSPGELGRKVPWVRERATGGAGRTEKVAVVVQTTFDPERFLDIARGVVSVSRATLVHNTLCEETLKRQREALELADTVEVMVVVGGKNSSNTRTLFDLVRKKVRAVHIEGSGELDERMFEGVERVGIISGASTPKEEVRDIARIIEGFSGR